MQTHYTLYIELGYHPIYPVRKVACFYCTTNKNNEKLQGIIVSGLAFYLQLWCLEKKGPVFTAIWQPLSFLVTLACSSFFLGEMIKLGRYRLCYFITSQFLIVYYIYTRTKIWRKCIFCSRSSMWLLPWCNFFDIVHLFWFNILLFHVSKTVCLFYF